MATAGAAYGWGINAGGRLGAGDSVASASPRPVVGGLTFAKVVAGGYHACGLTTGGAAYCWRYNSNGQIGDGTRTDRRAPVRVLGQP